MGYSLSWIAVDGNSSDQLDHLLQIRHMGAMEGSATSRCTSIRLASGYYLVIFDRKELPPALLGRVSHSLSLMVGYVEEHVMYSSVAAWENGQEKWAVVHDAQEGMYNLQVRGTPPGQHEAIRERLFTEQAANGGEKVEVDHIFDIPVELAHELIGYRYDTDAQQLGSSGYEAMEPGSKPTLLSRLFRRPSR
ncbi:MAG TPA: hypothetical protein VFP59_01900 [Candidatus Angelobacter sp.]|nr:hypothetical protein [Candidatus Angelobacter sp.]